MSITRRIILCGDSMFIKAIEAGLAEHPYLYIQRLDLTMTGLLSRIMAFEPDLVMVAEDETPDDLILALLKHSLPLVQLHNNQTALLTRQAVSLLCAADIEQLIKKVM